MEVHLCVIFSMYSDFDDLLGMWSVIYLCCYVKPYPWYGCYLYQVSAVMRFDMSDRLMDADIYDMIAYSGYMIQTCYE